MKKLLFLLVTILCITICTYAQDVQQRTISMNVYTSQTDRNNADNQLTFNREGGITYSEYIRGNVGGIGRPVMGIVSINTIKGRYFLDNTVNKPSERRISTIRSVVEAGRNDEITVTITWNNGFQETAQIRYDSKGKAVVTFRGLTFYEH